MNKSWRTITLGVVAILTAVLGCIKAILDSDPVTEPDITSLVAAVSAGIGLLFAKDAKVTGLPAKPEATE